MLDCFRELCTVNAQMDNVVLDVCIALGIVMKVRRNVDV